jgi:hypothetical protein
MTCFAAEEYWWSIDETADKGMTGRSHGDRLRVTEYVEWPSKVSSTGSMSAKSIAPRRSAQHL